MLLWTILTEDFLILIGTTFLNYNLMLKMFNNCINTRFVFAVFAIVTKSFVLFSQSEKNQNRFLNSLIMLPA